MNNMKVVFRESFQFRKLKINWYPGHMNKAFNSMQDSAHKVNIFLELRDARIPLTSENKELTSQIPSSAKHILILTKLDLASSSQTKTFLKCTSLPCLSTALHSSTTDLHSLIKSNLPHGFKTVPSQIQILGIPNIGKSTLLNKLRRFSLSQSPTSSSDSNTFLSKKGGEAQKNSARTGPVAAVTRGINKFKLYEDPLVYVLDTPGVGLKNIREEEDGLKLGVCGCLREGAVDYEYLCDYLLFKLNQARICNYVQVYDMKSPSDSLQDVLRAVRKKHGYRGDNESAIQFLKNFRYGKLGRITFDTIQK
jgi:mitochondrial GTPase 1